MLEELGYLGSPIITDVIIPYTYSSTSGTHLFKPLCYLDACSLEQAIENLVSCVFEQTEV